MAALAQALLSAPWVKTMLLQHDASVVPDSWQTFAIGASVGKGKLGDVVGAVMVGEGVTPTMLLS